MDFKAMLQDLPSRKWLPYIITFVGILLTVPIWYVLVQEDKSPLFAESLGISAPWMLLVFGFLASCLLGLFIRFLQVTHEREESLSRLTEEFEHQMAERAEAEETKQRLEKALLQGQKLQAIGTLAGGIAHDFNNLLYAITGYIEMAREDSDPNSITYHNMGKALEAAHRGKDLIGRILAFSRRQHHELKNIYIKETIHSVLSLLTPTIPASITVKIIDEILPTTSDLCILANATQLHQIFVNMINNAIDAMDGEGNIIIRLSRASRNADLLKQFPQAKADEYCKIEISDSGHGMDPSTLERMFEPFFTTKEVGKGTGLGLSTVHAIVESHHGEINVTSVLGKGTTFTILLPLSKSKES